MMSFLSKTDPDIANLITQELARQRDGLEMIPSENFTSLSVLEACGSILTNKYSEGYPGTRYYGGNEFIDQIEELARTRAKEVFGMSHANVQAYSGSPANQAVCFGLCNPGDTIMGMHLLYGGHLTHGWKVNFSGTYYKSVQYVTGQDGYMDYDALEKQVKEVKPKLLFVGATAYPRIFDWKKLSEIAKSVDAYLVTDVSHISGLIIGGVHPSPASYADVITTTTHKTLRGPRGAMILCNGEASKPLQEPPEKSKKYLPTMIDRAIFPGLQGGPHNHIVAGIATALKEAQGDNFKSYAYQIVKNAKTLAADLTNYGYNLVTGGTDNHLLLINLENKNIGGKDAENALSAAGITVNKNTVPFDKRKPYDPSGIRLGTPALTSRNMKEEAMKQVATFIHQALTNYQNADTLAKIRNEVKDFVKQYPLYPELT